jgi:hypothetical protein
MFGLRAWWWEPKRREAFFFGNHLPGGELPGIFFARLFRRKPQDSRCHSAASIQQLRHVGRNPPGLIGPRPYPKSWLHSEGWSIGNVCGING